MRLDLPIYACGGFSHLVTEQLPSLKACFEGSPWRAPRRSDRLTQLGLLGLTACTGTNNLAADTPLILASSESTLSSTIQINEQIYLNNSIPNPFGFINSVNNSTAFYLNQTLGIAGRSLTVARDQCSLEAALQIAALWQHEHQGPLLVGTVDELPEDLQQHRIRMQYHDDALLGEGSFWFLCGAALPGDNPMAIVRSCGSLPDPESAIECMYSNGVSHFIVLETAEAEHISIDELPGTAVELPSPGLFSTQNGYYLIKGLERLSKGDRLCLINSKRRSARLSLTIIERC